MRGGQIVSSPDGDRWRVKRRWTNRPLPDWRRRWRSKDRERALDAGAETLAWTFTDSIAFSIAAGVAAVILVFVLWPLLGLAFELILLFLAPGVPVRLAGWGLTELSDTAPSVLQTGEMNTRSHRHCERRARAFDLFYSPSQQLCAGDLPSEEVATCSGDSGGPVIAPRLDGTQVEVGIVSNGGSFCDPYEPNIFTRVETVAEWAQAWIAAVETGAPAPTEPKAHLPRLTISHAWLVQIITLEEVLRDRYRIFPLRCQRKSKVEVRCKSSWTLGRNRFSAAFTSRWTVRRNQVVLDGNYVIRRIRLKCLAGQHPGTCPVHIRRG